MFMKKNNNDKIILDLKKQVELKKKLLKDSEKFNPYTNCSLLFHGERYNINVIDGNTILILLATLNSFRESLRSIFPEETLEISGFSVDHWIDDLKSKFRVLNRRLEMERLKKLEARLHNLLSLDTKIELEIEDLKSQI